MIKVIFLKRSHRPKKIQVLINTTIMEKFIIEKKMINETDGHYLVVIEGQKHLNRTEIKSDITYFTTRGGYNYSHPESRAKKYAEKIAFGLNMFGSKHLKLEHLPTCNLKQDWSEALDAMASTPEKFRDASFYEAETELSVKMKTCTCGLDGLKKLTPES